MTDIIQLSFLRQRDIEKLFAASAYLFPQYTLQVCGWLRPEDLQNEQVQRFWSLMTERIDANMSDDDASTAAIQAAIEAGIHLDLNNWQQDLGMTPMPQAYAAEISRRRYLAQVAILNTKLAMAVGSQDDEQAKQVISELSEIGRRGRSQIPTAPDVAEKFNQSIIGGGRVVDTFIPPLDQSLGGLERKTETIIAGRPSMGKTALAWQIARNAAAANHEVLFFSLEMSSESLWARAACPLVGVSWRAVKTGGLTRERLAELQDKSSELAVTYGEHLRIIDSPQSTDTVWMACAEYRPDLVVIDHLRLLRDQSEKETKRLGIITQRAKEIAKAFNLALVLTAQLNRDVEKRGKGNYIPTLSDLRDSGEIEENADVILMLYRPDYYDAPKIYNPNSALDIWVRKFRDGIRDCLVKVNYNLDKQWIEPLDKVGKLL